MRRPCQCLADCALLSVQRKAVLDEVQADSGFALRMLAGLSRRLRLVSDVQAYALQNGVQRVIGYLLRDQAMDDERADDAVTVSLPVSKATLASRPVTHARVLLAGVARARRCQAD